MAKKIDPLSISITRDAEALNQFMSMYHEQSPSEAFKLLESLVPSQNVKTIATKMANELMSAELEATLDYLQRQDSELKPSILGTSLIQDFLRDYYTENDLEGAYRKATTKITHDENLRSNGELRNTLDRVKRDLDPKIKEGAHKIDVTAANENVIHLTSKGRSKFKSHLTPGQADEIVKKWTRVLFAAPHKEVDTERFKKIAVSGNVDLMIHSARKNEIPLLVKVASEDIKELSAKGRTQRDQFKVAQRSMTTLLKDLDSKGIPLANTSIDKDEAKREAMGAISITGTERVNIVRTLLDDMRTMTTSEAFNKAIKKAKDQNDPRIVELLEKNQPAVATGHSALPTDEESINSKTKLLLDTYKVIMPNINEKHYEHSTRAEVTLIATGNLSRMENLHAAFDEINHRKQIIGEYYSERAHIDHVMTHYENSEAKGVDTYKLSKRHGAFTKNVNEPPSISESINENAAQRLETAMGSQQMN